MCQSTGWKKLPQFSREEKCNEESKCVGVHVVCGMFHTFQLCSGNGLGEGSKQEKCADVVFVKPGKI